MKTNLLKSSARVIRKNGLYYLLDDKNKIQKFKPWLGDLFSFLYDTIMEKSVFPKKFGGTIQKHFDFLKKELAGIQGQTILEIATGSGNAVHFLNQDNFYTGIDISSGLLQRAVKKLDQYGFHNAELYVCGAEHLPFRDNHFDVGLCMLSLNFLKDANAFISELKRVLKPGAVFFCVVPVPEKIKPGVKIHGILRTEQELRSLFQNYNFVFEAIKEENGALLYYQARVNK